MKRALFPFLKQRIYHSYHPGVTIEPTSSGLQGTGEIGFGTAGNFRNFATILQSADSVPPVVDASWKFDVKSMRHDCYMKNGTNNRIYVKMYWCRNKHNTSASAGNPTTLFSTPRTAWIQGLADQALTAGNVISPDIGVTPMEATSFSHFYKVTRVKGFNLGVGESKKVKWARKNFIVNLKDYEASTFIGMKGVTEYILFTVHGDLCAPAGGATATFSAAQLIVLGTTTIKIRNTPDNLSDKAASYITASELPGTANGFTIDYTLNASTAVVINT